MEKMLVVLHTKLLTLEIRLKNLFENCQKVIKENEPNFWSLGQFYFWIFGQLELTNSTCIAGGNFDTSLCPPLLLLRLL